jgi:hypothetical protein
MRKVGMCNWHRSISGHREIKQAPKPCLFPLHLQANHPSGPQMRNLPATDMTSGKTSGGGALPPFQTTRSRTSAATPNALGPSTLLSPLKSVHQQSSALRTPSASGAALMTPQLTSMRPSAALGLRVALPVDDAECEPPSPGNSGNGGLCYSPSTPAVKAGIKERMKFYFQRQAGSGGPGL